MELMSSRVDSFGLWEGGSVLVDQTGVGMGPDGVWADGDNPEFSEHVNNAIFLR